MIAPITADRKQEDLHGVGGIKQPIPATRASRLLELDGLRGVACMAVLVFHYSKYLTRHHEFGWSFFYGVTGVDLFFLISGFVIYMTLVKTRKVSDFVVSRFTRLYPVFWFAVILTSVVCLLFSYNLDVVSLKSFLANLTMTPVWFGSPYIDNSYWTLMVELQFYCVIGLFYFAVKRYSVLSKSIFLLAVFTVLNAVSVYFDFGRKIIMYFPISAFWGWFFAGMLFYKFKNQQIKASLFYPLLAWNLGFVYLTHSQAGTAQYYTAAWEHTALVAFYMIIFYLFTLDKLSFLSRKVFVFLGGISYSVYLLHQTIGYVLLDKSMAVFKEPYLAFTVTILLILLASFFTNIYVEKPFMKILRNLIKGKKEEQVKLIN